jgi:hypothetical protein
LTEKCSRLCFMPYEEFSGLNFMLADKEGSQACMSRKKYVIQNKEAR